MPGLPNTFLKDKKVTKLNLDITRFLEALLYMYKLNFVKGEFLK